MSEALKNFDNTKFFGAGYEPQHDHERLTGQLARLHEYMISRRDQWVTLREISDAVIAPEASVSAGLRTLRNQYLYEVKRKRKADERGTFLYMLGERNQKPKKKKLKPIGDPKLFGEMMRSIYAYANLSDIPNLADMSKALDKWGKALAHEIHSRKADYDFNV